MFLRWRVALALARRFALRAAFEASAFGGSLLFACAKRINQEKHTPAGPLFLHVRVQKKSPAVLAERGPPNNSHVPVLKQFGFLPLSAPLLGGPDGAHLKNASILR